MSALEEVQRTLGSVLTQLDATAKRISAALNSCEESQQTLEMTLAGSTDQQAGEAISLLGSAVRELAELHGIISVVRRRVAEYSARLGTVASSNEVTTAARPGSPRRPPDAVGVDGSRYPPEAAWAVPELPSRVGKFEGRTVGKLKIGDQPIPGTFRSDARSDLWAEKAATRIKTLGIRAPRFLRFHVEMRIAAMMVERGVTSAEVVINNVPCGYQSRPPGCHQVLEPFLPEGSRITVMGTDIKGRPYRRTYHGKATR